VEGAVRAEVGPNALGHSSSAPPRSLFWGLMVKGQPQLELCAILKVPKWALKKLVEDPDFADSSDISSSCN